MIKWCQEGGETANLNDRNARLAVEYGPEDREGMSRETSDVLWRDFRMCEPVDAKLDHCCEIFLEVPYIEIEVRVGGLVKVEIFPVDRCPQCGRFLRDARKLKHL